MSIAGVLLVVVMIVSAGLIGLVIGAVACGTFPDWVPEEPESGRDKAKRKFDRMMAKLRVVERVVVLEGPGCEREHDWRYNPLTDQARCMKCGHSEWLV